MPIFLNHCRLVLLSSWHVKFNTKFEGGPCGEFTVGGIGAPITITITITEVPLRFTITKGISF